MADESLIEDLALLSDCHSAALVARTLDVVWLCHPRFDSPSVFGRLLDPDAGHTGITVSGARSHVRRYLPKTLVLETEVESDAGAVTVTDALASGPNPDGHSLCSSPPRVLVRRIECVRGEVEVTVEHRPRPEYGVVVPLLTCEPGAVRARGGPTRVTLSLPWPAQVAYGAATATGRLRMGDVLLVGVEVGALAEPPLTVRTQQELQHLLDETVAAWRGWSGLHQTYAGEHRALVHHSGRVLYALTYQPTGAVVAAPTTSLPEELGGTRNWDYRYTWLRDASWTMSALWVAACPDEAMDFFEYLTWSTAGRIDDHHRAQIMFGVGGEHDLTERELSHLHGYAGSLPVRVGNGAWDQDQLDVYGELLDAAYRLRDQLGTPPAHVVTFLASMADTAAARWQEPDQGIWEVRGEPRRFLHSQLMCWVALDRAARLAPVLGTAEDGARWRAEAERVREALLVEGWNDRMGAFTQSFGGEELDAAALMVPLVGFLPSSDPRVRSTVDAVERILVDERGLVRRYLTESGVDGVAGDEGSFVLCTFWLSQALARDGEVDRARVYFDRAAAYANDLGLMAEEVDTGTGRLLGNFPQAFSHVGLVNAARDLDRASTTE
jgi:alpha,alpha-trehalase